MSPWPLAKLEFSPVLTQIASEIGRGYKVPFGYESMHVSADKIGYDFLSMTLDFTLDDSVLGLPEMIMDL
jgi:hypothetical protein